MTELLQGELEVRLAGGSPVALRTRGGWREVAGVAGRWRVETDWWRRPVRREYLRCLLAGGECCELYRDLDGDGWFWSRRYD